MILSRTRLPQCPSPQRPPNRQISDLKQSRLSEANTNNRTNSTGENKELLDPTLTVIDTDPIGIDRSIDLDTDPSIGAIASRTESTEGCHHDNTNYLHSAQRDDLKHSIKERNSNSPFRHSDPESAFSENEHGLSDTDVASRSSESVSKKAKSKIEKLHLDEFNSSIKDINTQKPPSLGEYSSNKNTQRKLLLEEVSESSLRESKHLNTAVTNSNKDQRPAFNQPISETDTSDSSISTGKLKTGMSQSAEVGKVEIQSNSTSSLPISFPYFYYADNSLNSLDTFNLLNQPETSQYPNTQHLRGNTPVSPSSQVVSNSKNSGTDNSLHGPVKENLKQTTEEGRHQTPSLGLVHTRARVSQDSFFNQVPKRFSQFILDQQNPYISQRLDNLSMISQSLESDAKKSKKLSLNRTSKSASQGHSAHSRNSHSQSQSHSSNTNTLSRQISDLMGSQATIFLTRQEWLPGMANLPKFTTQKRGYLLRFRKLRSSKVKQMPVLERRHAIRAKDGKLYRLKMRIKRLISKLKQLKFSSFTVSSKRMGRSKLLRRGKLVKISTPVTNPYLGRANAQRANLDDSLKTRAGQVYMETMDPRKTTGESQKLEGREFEYKGVDKPQISQETKQPQVEEVKPSYLEDNKLPSDENLSKKDVPRSQTRESLFQPPAPLHDYLEKESRLSSYIDQQQQKYIEDMNTKRNSVAYSVYSGRSIDYSGHRLDPKYSENTKYNAAPVSEAGSQPESEAPAPPPHLVYDDEVVSLLNSRDKLLESPQNVPRDTYQEKPLAKEITSQERNAPFKEESSQQKEAPPVHRIQIPLPSPIQPPEDALPSAQRKTSGPALGLRLAPATRGGAKRFQSIIRKKNSRLHTHLNSTSSIGSPTPSQVDLYDVWRSYLTNVVYKRILLRQEISMYQQFMVTNHKDRFSNAEFEDESLSSPDLRISSLNQIRKNYSIARSERLAAKSDMLTDYLDSKSTHSSDSASDVSSPTTKSLEEFSNDYLKRRSMLGEMLEYDSDSELITSVSSSQQGLIMSSVANFNVQQPRSSSWTNKSDSKMERTYGTVRRHKTLLRRQGLTTSGQSSSPIRRSLGYQYNLNELSLS